MDIEEENMNFLESSNKEFRNDLRSSKCKADTLKSIMSFSGNLSNPKCFSKTMEIFKTKNQNFVIPQKLVVFLVITSTNKETRNLKM